ncbi:hypothetical protein V6N13_065603 [Hibiscus sabdariffa]
MLFRALDGDFNAILNASERLGGSSKRVEDDPNFVDMLMESWSSSASPRTNVVNFCSNAKVWNMDVFYHIGKRKSILLGQILGIEATTNFSSNNFLLERE